MSDGEAVAYRATRAAQYRFRGGMMVKYSMATLLLCAWCATLSYAQSVRPQAFNAQLRTDPAVGNVQGIQRFGRPLRTDPDQGVGYSYHVYPVAGETRDSFARVASYELDAAYGDLSRAEQELARAQREQGDADIPALERAVRNAAIRADRLGFRAGAFTRSGPSAFDPQYGEPFDATRGLRNFSGPLSAPELFNRRSAALAVGEARAFGVSAAGSNLVKIYHQPLIQIKVRVIEVVRDDGFQANSILEIVGKANTNPSLTSGQPANNMFENFRSISRFAQQGLATSATQGTGLLLNATSQHINWATQLLATEFNGDVVTAPEVVTLNGQNVEFVSGQKLPFELGQNVIQGTNNNIQQFFYKNIGTYVSVTPKIVNWGFHAEGSGESPILATEIKNWHRLGELMLDPTYFAIGETLRREIEPYFLSKRPFPFALKQNLLAELNRYSRSDIVGRVVQHVGDVVTYEGGIPGVERIVVKDSLDPCRNCDWEPSDCTIDLMLVVRLSEGGTIDISTETEGTLMTKSLNTEKNVRAVANVIQIKSGEGVVMAGLIGEREAEVVRKIPVLGDIPGAGFFFRSKQTTRQTPEGLIFIEAQVLDPRPDVARAESGHDFQLGKPYLGHELLDNPLDLGMHRVGFGTYLPPTRHAEELYWERYGRKVRKIATHLDDAIK